MALIRRLAVLAKIESTYGVDPTPSPSADAVVVESFTWQYPTEIEDPEAAAASMSPIRHVLKRRTAELSFDVPLKGSGTAGTAPEYGPLLRACGFLETIDPGVSVLYTPTSTAHASVTIYANVDGFQFKVRGCRGNVEIIAEAGDKLRLRFTMMGMPDAPTAVAFPTVSNIDTTLPLRVRGATIVLAGTALAGVAGYSIDVANTVEYTDDINAADGLGGAIIRSRLPVGTINPEMPALGTFDFWTLSESAPVAFTSTFSTGGAGNTVAIGVDRLAVREFQPADRAGLLINEVPFLCVGSASGDDEVEILLT